MEVYDEVVKKKAAENPLFKEILESQLAFAQRVTRWEQDTVVNRRIAFDHYFGPNAAAKNSNARGIEATHHSVMRPGGALSCPEPPADRLRSMNVQRFCTRLTKSSVRRSQGRGLAHHRAHDPRLRRGVQALHHQRATAWIFDASNISTAHCSCLHSTYALTTTPMSAATFLQLHAAAHPRAAARHNLYIVFFCPHRHPDIHRLRLRPRLMRDQQTLERHCRRSSQIYHFQNHDSDRWALVMLQGVGRDRTLHHLPQDQMATA